MREIKKYNLESDIEIIDTMVSGLFNNRVTEETVVVAEAIGKLLNAKCRLIGIQLGLVGFEALKKLQEEDGLDI